MLTIEVSANVSMPNGNAFVSLNANGFWKWVEMKNSSHMIRFDSLRFSRMSRAHKIKYVGCSCRVFMHVVRYQFLQKKCCDKHTAHSPKDNYYFYSNFVNNLNAAIKSMDGFYARNFPLHQKCYGFECIYEMLSVHCERCVRVKGKEINWNMYICTLIFVSPSIMM